jgi:hypothetical protein
MQDALGTMEGWVCDGRGRGGGGGGVTASARGGVHTLHSELAALSQASATQGTASSLMACTAATKQGARPCRRALCAYGGSCPPPPHTPGQKPRPPPTRARPLTQGRGSATAAPLPHPLPHLHIRLRERHQHGAIHGAAVNGFHASVAEQHPPQVVHLRQKLWAELVQGLLVQRLQHVLILSGPHQGGTLAVPKVPVGTREECSVCGHV